MISRNTMGQGDYSGKPSYELDNLNSTQKLLLDALEKKKMTGQKLSQQEEKEYNRLVDIAQTKFLFR
jgi:hypothetical protein